MRLEGFKYEVYVKQRGKWVLVARCLTEDDARTVADRRAESGQSAKVEDGERLLYKLA